MRKIASWFTKPRLIWIGLVAIAAVLVVAGRFAGLNASEWASWVQAIGSIGAIAGSFALARSGANDASAAQKGSELLRAYELAVAADFLAEEVERAIADTVRKFEAQRVRVRPIGNERLLQLQESLTTFAHREMQPLLLKQILILQREVAYSLTAIREVGKRTTSEKRVYNAQMRLHRVQSCRHQINGQIGDYVERLTKHWMSS